MTTLRKIVCLALLAGLSLSSPVLAQDEAPRDVVQAFAQACDKSDAAAAWKLLSKADQAAIDQMREDLADMMGSEPELEAFPGVTVKDLQGMKPEEFFAALMNAEQQEQGKSGPLAGYRFVSEEIDGDKGTAVVTVKVPDGEDENGNPAWSEEQIGLVKEDGKWLIDMFSRIDGDDEQEGED